MKKGVFILMMLVAFSAAAGEEIKVGIKGMVCAFCAQGIEKTFKAQKEVDDVKVSLKDKYVKIKFKDGEKLPKEKVAELIKDAGYEPDFEAKK